MFVCKEFCYFRKIAIWRRGYSMIIIRSLYLNKGWKIKWVSFPSVKTCFLMVVSILTDLSYASTAKISYAFEFQVSDRLGPMGTIINDKIIVCKCGRWSFIMPSMTHNPEGLKSELYFYSFSCTACLKRTKYFVTSNSFGTSKSEVTLG